MPRQARKKAESGIYRVMLRGIDRQQIFEGVILQKTENRPLSYLNFSGGSDIMRRVLIVMLFLMLICLNGCSSSNKIEHLFESFNAETNKNIPYVHHNTFVFDDVTLDFDALQRHKDRGRFSVLTDCSNNQYGGERIARSPPYFCEYNKNAIAKAMAFIDAVN